MPTGVLSDAERGRLDRTASTANRLGFALPLGALRLLGFGPDDLGTAPEAVVVVTTTSASARPPPRIGPRSRAGSWSGPWSTTDPPCSCAWPASTSSASGPTRAVQEYGRLVNTVFVLPYRESVDYRRRILGQLNKAEALHSPRGSLPFANKGVLRKESPGRVHGEELSGI